MRKRIAITLALILAILLSLCACTVLKPARDSIFRILFIDVGQGDSALVECDGHYMLIDGGDSAAGDTVYNELAERGIQKLDILAISHMHADHIGGLIKALSYASSIGITISNSTYGNTETFRNLEHQLEINGSSITVPHTGDEYKLGSSTVEVIDAVNEESNDSLVLLITYEDTKFLFTGDIEYAAQKRIYEKYIGDVDNEYKIDLIKMPHHGAYSGSLYNFIRTFMPDYAIISVGAGNKYGHPDKKTLDMLDSKTYRPEVYRTDKNGSITVKSNGKELFVETEK